MPSYERALSLPQAFNFKKDVQTPFGFITKLVIGGQTVPADLALSAPVVTGTGGDTNVLGGAVESTKTNKMVGVLRNIKWDLGDTDPIVFSGNVSVEGKQVLMGLLYTSMVESEVTVSFCIFEYDPIRKSYYCSFQSSTNPAQSLSGGGSVEGLIKKDGENLLLTVKPDPSPDIQSPENYEFELSVSPATLKQQIVLLSTSYARKVTKNWGRVLTTTAGS